MAVTVFLSRLFPFPTSCLYLIALLLLCCITFDFLQSIKNEASAAIKSSGTFCPIEKYVIDFFVLCEKDITFPKLFVSSNFVKIK